MSIHIYVHIPYCIKKCRYCGFSSVENRNPPEERYVNALLIEAARLNVMEKGISTVFIGGGTPTLFSPAGIGKVIDGLEKTFGFRQDVEISIEANPETITGSYALELKAAGVNRTSLGVQSFSQRIIKYLGRVHDAGKSIDAYRSLRRAGFANINIDLMYAIPSEEIEELEKDLKMIEALGPEHVSAYMFSPDTIWAESLNPLSEEYAESFFLCVVERLERCGIEQYEISNFAQRGYECRHNISYWRYMPYIGLGASSVSCSKGMRLTNIRKPDKYMDTVFKGKSPVENKEVLSDETQDFERKFLLLRTKCGIPIELMPEGLPENLYREVNGRAVLTSKGFLLSNEIFKLL